MKKLIYLFSIITLLISSCGSDPTELNVKDLEDPCDFVEALADNYKAQINLYEDNEDDYIDEWSKKDRKKLKKLQKLVRKIHKRSEKIIEDDFDEDEEDFEDEIEDCDGWDDFEELQDELSDLESGSNNDICDCVEDAIKTEDIEKIMDCFPKGMSEDEAERLYKEVCEGRGERDEYDYDEGASHYESCGGAVEETAPAACGGCGHTEEAATEACGGCGDAEGCGDACGEDACGEDAACGGCGKDEW